MKVRLLLVAAVASILLLCVPAAFSQTQPICGTLCGPDPNGSSYGGVVVARSQPLNARGQSSAITPVVKKAIDLTWGHMSVVVARVKTRRGPPGTDLHSHLSYATANTGGEVTSEGITNLGRASLSKVASSACV